MAIVNRRRSEVVQWIDAALARLDATAPVRPEHVLKLRRTGGSRVPVVQVKTALRSDG
jgi:hypothetical protein